jgi:hypothetical protein
MRKCAFRPACGLVAAEDGEQIERPLRAGHRPNLLTRIVLTEDLRRHALALAAGPVRMALRSGEAPRVRATLDILVAWERAIPLDDLREFLEHGNATSACWPSGWRPLFRSISKAGWRWCDPCKTRMRPSAGWPSWPWAVRR